MAEIDVRPLLPAQLEYFSKENAHAKPAAFFNRYFFNLPVTEEEEIKVGIALDLGGSKLSWASFHRVNGRVIQSSETGFEPSQEGGRNYLQLLEKLSERTGSLAVGISTTGSVEETILTRTNNLPGFLKDLNTKYGGDFANVFPQSCRLVVMNDAVAGAMGSLYNLAIFGNLAVENAIYLINGSGINAAVWQNGQIWSTELGAIQIDPQLAESMGLDETDTPQVRPIASGTGIAIRWENKTGKKLAGDQIAGSRHPLTERLYDDSAFVAAHIAAGLGQDFGLFETPESTSLICHGGVFNVPGYAEKLGQYLKDYFGFMPQMMVGGDNPGLKGAALAVLS